MTNTVDTNELSAGEYNVDKYVHWDNKIQSIYSVLYLITVVDVYIFFWIFQYFKDKKAYSFTTVSLFCHRIGLNRNFDAQRYLHVHQLIKSVTKRFKMGQFSKCINRESSTSIPFPLWIKTVVLWNFVHIFHLKTNVDYFVCIERTSIWIEGFSITKFWYLIANPCWKSFSMHARYGSLEIYKWVACPKTK